MANQPLNEKQLQALLRLKRHEQPPPGYFDDLLHAVQRRQREEMLRRPAWKLMAERVGAFFASLRRDWAYAGSMAGILMIGIGVIQMALPRKVEVVVNKPANPSVAALPPEGTIVQVPNVPNVPFGITPEAGKRGNPNLRQVKTLRSGPPRFVIDTMPATYEQTQIQF